MLNAVCCVRIDLRNKITSFKNPDPNRWIRIILDSDFNLQDSDYDFYGFDFNGAEFLMESSYRKFGAARLRDKKAQSLNGFVLKSPGIITIAKDILRIMKASETKPKSLNFLTLVWLWTKPFIPLHSRSASKFSRASISLYFTCHCHFTYLQTKTLLQMQDHFHWSFEWRQLKWSPVFSLFKFGLIPSCHESLGFRSSCSLSIDIL